jgi:hypothetical protein
MLHGIPVWSRLAYSLGFEENSRSAAQIVQTHAYSVLCSE